MSEAREVAIGRLRTPAKWGGILLTLLACGYVIVQIVETGAFSGIPWNDPWLWISLAALSIGYAIVQIPLALAWRQFVVLAGVKNFSARLAVSIYAPTQLLKYLPFNIFHYVGRHVAMRRIGCPHDAIVFAMFAEVYVISFTALSLAMIVGGNLFGQAMVSLNQEHRATIVLLISAIILFFILPAGFIVFLRRRIHAAVNLIIMAVTSSVVLYCIFFTGTGIVVSVLLLFVGGGGGLNILFVIISAVVMSWVFGFLVPGSTAGIGIREFIFIGVLTPFLGSSGAVELAILYRLITVIGDVAFGGIGLLLRGSPC